MSRIEVNAKVVLLGESAVGKTSIVTVLNTGDFFEDVAPTVGACFQVKKIVNKDTTVKLNIWDTAGQERFRSLAPMFYRDADIVILVYAIDAQESFEALTTWLDSLKVDCPVMPKVYIVGNKNDLEETRIIQAREAQSFARTHGCPFYEVSAKTSRDDIVELFDNVAITAVKVRNAPQNHDNEMVDVSSDPKGCKC